MLLFVYRCVLVSIKSLATGHTRNRIRERTADKIEEVFFDPWGKFLL